MPRFIWVPLKNLNGGAARTCRKVLARESEYFQMKIISSRDES